MTPSESSLCGNLFLDPGEQCDTGGETGAGCTADACQLQAGWQCSDGSSACLFPCQAYTAPQGLHGTKGQLRGAIVQIRGAERRGGVLKGANACRVM